jgi:hypothetical protein
MNSFECRFVSVILRIGAVLSTGALCVSVIGCGNGLAKVSGVVTIDGRPLHGGTGDTRVTVQFLPASGNGPTAIGLADENGNYTLGTGSQMGIPPGDYLVICSASELVRGKDPTATAGGRRVTDPKYANAKTSGLKFSVQSGKNEFNIPLESPSKKSTRNGA